MSTANAATRARRPWNVFFQYTAWSVVMVMVMVPLGVALFVELPLQHVLDHRPTGILLAVQAIVAAWSSYAAMTRWSRGPAPGTRDRWDLPRTGSLRFDASLLLVVAPTLLLGALHLVSGTESRGLVISAAILASTLTIRVRWEWGALAAVATGVLATAVDVPLVSAVPAAAVTFAAVITVRLSLWLAAMVRELDLVREAQAQLAVADERLRFARDLHDVTGRDLSVIAVTSELVAQLVERRDSRALEHSREVAQIARTSLAEIRGLVRGYREADLGAELRGTVSLLRSAHVQVEVDGSADAVPAAHADTAAWVLREGGTNILRHADPTTVMITLGAGGVTLVNDGARADGEVVEGSGLTGMRERLDAGTLTTRLDGGRFTLDVRFDTPGDPR